MNRDRRTGWLDPDLKTHPDTTSQTVSLLKDVQTFLQTQKLTLGDVVMMHVYLGGDPAKDGKMDVAGARAGYSQFFGTKGQSHRAGDSARMCSWRFDRNRLCRNAPKVAAIQGTPHEPDPPLFGHCLSEGRM
jgi:hypothetical protein